jgi:hypothetical protein
MGITFSKSLNKVKNGVNTSNQKGFHWVSQRRFQTRKAIPRLRNGTTLRYQKRSKVSLSLIQN